MRALLLSHSDRQLRFTVLAFLSASYVSFTAGWTVHVRKSDVGDRCS
jgi:hypothetical protein